MKRLFSFLYDCAATCFSVALILLFIGIVIAMRKFDEVASRGK